MTGQDDRAAGRRHRAGGRDQMTGAALRLLGTFELKLSDGRVVDLPGQKDRALLAALALSTGTALSREKLASLLWSDRGDAQARDSLKHALTRIRQCFGDGAPCPIIADRQSVRLDPAGLAIDTNRFEDMVRSGTPEALEQASTLCAGDLLDGISIRDASFEDWLQVERQRLRRLHEAALLGLLASALPVATRERAARHLIALDPLREAASRALMRIHVERGETAQAIKLFEALRERLHAELGVKPELETTRLYESLRERRTDPSVPLADPDAVMLPAEPALPTKPSIACLPFQNLSDDPEQEYFADGMVEEIITALSRMRWLFVIARNSSFTYRNRAVDVKQIGRELGVRYILEGSVRKAANRVRITGQLIDASTGANLWADRFDGGLEEVFDLQDRVATSVVGAIAPKLEQAEIERTKRKPTGSLDAYDHYLRGMACVHRWTRETSDEALQHFRRAIALDPDYTSAYGMVARCYSQRKVSGWVTDPEQEIAEFDPLGETRGAVRKGRFACACHRRDGARLRCRESRGRRRHDRAGAGARSKPGLGLALQWLDQGLARRVGNRAGADTARHAPQPAGSTVLQHANRRRLGLSTGGALRGGAVMGPGRPARTAGLSQPALHHGGLQRARWQPGGRKEEPRSHAADRSRRAHLQHPATLSFPPAA